MRLVRPKQPRLLQGPAIPSLIPQRARERGRERGREREREREREKYREREREREGQTDRQRETETDRGADCTSTRVPCQCSNFISQVVIIKSFCKSQFPHKSVNISFIVTNLTVMLTDSLGD